MAKRVAVPDEETVEERGGIKAKKKRNCCCTCCLVVLIVVLVIFLAAFVAGWILGDKYTKKLFGLSMADTVGVLNDLYWTDDDDVVTRPFNQNDLNGFYSEIKRNVLLKDSAQVDFDTALDAAIEKFLETGGDGEHASANALNASADGEDGGSDITDILVNMIADVLDRDNIDIERLNKYDANNPASDEYIFNLNDKQLAAFVNSVLTKVLKNASKLNDFKEISDMVKLDTVVALKQIRFTAKSSKNENGEEEVKASSADITVWIGLQSAANQAIKKFMADLGHSWAGGIVGWLGDVILPKNIYLTISVPLKGENKASIVINDMDAEERARANKLINGIIKLSTGDENARTLDEVIDSFIVDIKPTLEEATDRMDFTNASSGTISMDLLDSVAKLASDGMDTPLTKADFLYVLQALFSDPTEQLNKLTPFRYDNWYKVDGKEIYMSSGGNKENRIDYEQEFIKEIGNKYAVKFDDGTTLTGVLEMLGISLDGENNSADSKDLLNRVDGDKFDALLDEEIRNIKLTVTDRMLGAALSKQMAKIVSGNADLSGLEMQLDALTFVEKADASGKPNKHLYALLAVEAKIGGMLDSLGGDGDKLMTKLATGLMPESILLTMTVDITRDRGITRDKAEFIINSCANTDRVLATLEKLVPDFKLSDISDQVSNTLNEMLDQIDDKVHIELTPHTYVPNEEMDVWEGNGGALVMPDIFTIVTDMVLVKDGKSVVTPAQLKNVIRDLNSPAEIKENDVDDGCEAFIGQVFDKYYLESPQKKITDLDGLTEYMSKKFSTDDLRVQGNDGFAHDKRTMEQLRPIMTSDELFALLKDKIKGDDTVGAYTILNVEVGDNTLKVVVSVGLKDLLAGAGEVRSLIKADALYATATFHIDQITTVGSDTGYEVDFDINIEKNGEATVMDDDAQDAMFEIVRFFSTDFDIKRQLRKFGVILYDEMNTLSDSLGGEDYDKPLFTFTDDGLKLTDFYTFLALKMEPDLLKKYTNEDIRKTVQGLYDYDATKNENNFKVDDIMFNLPSEKGKRRWTDTEVVGLYGNTHLDVDFNGFLKQGVERMANDGEVTVEQTMILAKGDDRQNVQDVRDWLNGKLALGEDEDVDVGSDYIAITFSMSMTSYVGEDEKDGEKNDAQSLFPGKIYATVVYKYDETAAVGEMFTVVGGISDVAPVLVFNNMDSTQYEIMVKLMGANPNNVETGATDDNKVNMKSIAKKGAEVLNGMSHYEYNIGGVKGSADTVISFSRTATGESGMGKIYISKPTISGLPSVGA